MRARSCLVAAIVLALIGVALYAVVRVRDSDRQGRYGPKPSLARADIAIPRRLARPSGPAPAASDLDYLMPPEWRQGAGHPGQRISDRQSGGAK